MAPGLKRAIENKIFAGRLRALGNVNIIVKTNENALTSAAPVGTLCYYTYGDANDTYICTVASGTWVKINA